MTQPRFSSRLISRLREHAGQRGSEVAIRDPAGQFPDLTWSDLARRVDAIAASIQSSTGPFSVLIFQCPNSPDFAPIFLGILAAGRVVFPLPPELTEIELASAAARSRAAARIGPDGIAHPIVSSAIKPAPAPWATETPIDGPALLLLSSGTTGLPKIVLRDGPSLDAVSAAMVESIGFTPADRVLATVPLCHSYGLEHGLLAPIWAGSTVCLCRGLDMPLVERQLGAGGITLVPGVPAMFEMLAHRPDIAARSIPTLRIAYSAGAPLPAAVFNRLADATGLRVGQLYGATEIGSVTFNDPHRPGFDSASVGRAMNGVQIRLIPTPGADAQVAIRADSMFRGYLGESSPNDPDGFFLTGDLGRIDSDGNLFITGRLKLLIDIGGLKVSPIEIEQALCEHPGVRACVVLAMPLSETVNRLKAIIEPRDLDHPVTPAEMRDFARQRLTAYKVPRVIEVRASLPRSASGKVVRHLVASGSGPQTRSP